mmetsp:Transcript_25253/g.39099  ORF Transcript_25253/g.39099 Transcript_25253/m.39099 type:complete len:175 (-) Transcript_25253:144-668(-)
MSSKAVFNSTSRRLMSSAAANKLDWASPMWKASPELAAKANAFRSWVNSVDTLAAKYSADPAPVDFKSEKAAAIRAQDLISNLESFYKSTSLPAEKSEWDPADKAAKEALIAQAEQDQEETKALIAELEALAAERIANRTDRKTSVKDIYKLYPEIEKEVETEIDDRKWFKDTM